jgi:hypothetical protein
VNFPNVSEAADILRRCLLFHLLAIAFVDNLFYIASQCDLSNLSAAHSLQMSRAAARAIMQKANERTAVYFAVSIAGLSFVLASAQFANVILVNSHPSGRGVLAKNLIKKSRYGYILKALGLSNKSYRFIRSGLLHKVPLFPSLGHALVFTIYVAINITLLLQNLDLSVPRNWAKRMGW